MNLGRYVIFHFSGKKRPDTGLLQVRGSCEFGYGSRFFILYIVIPTGVHLSSCHRGDPITLDEVFAKIHNIDSLLS